PGDRRLNVEPDLRIRRGAKPRFIEPGFRC
ncbi:MAG: hypothetical protein ACI8UO_006412, partial [Verrucomicrobiales bacterium]